MRWYEYLFDRLGTKLDEVRLSRLSVITFNYDRSFEYSFFSRLGNAFGLDEDDAVQVLREIPIVHVHGQLGLPHFLDSGGREYNTVTSAETVKLAAKGIKIVHELEGESEEFVMAHELISNAERLAFLGFGYHQENVRRLRLRLFSGNEMVGTAYGLTYAEQEDVAKFDGMEGMTFANEETKILKFLRSSRVLR